MSHPYVVGLTGGIGSGKSTVAELFEKLGITIIDTDQIAREVVAPGTPALKALSEHFGKQILKDQQLNRGKLRDLIFTNLQEKEWVEKLLHPLIRKQIAIKLAAVTTPYCLLVVPLLIEKHPYPFVNRILNVDVDQDTQIARASHRDNKSAEEIIAIIDSQASREQRLQLSDDIIHNTGSLVLLEQQVNHLHQKYLKLAKKQAN